MTDKPVSYRFLGFAMPLEKPTIQRPFEDAFGWEVMPDGKFYVVRYTAGVREAILVANQAEAESLAAKMRAGHEV